MAVLSFLALQASNPAVIKMMDIYGQETISDIQCSDKAWGDFTVDINIGEGSKKPQYHLHGDVRLMYYNTLTIKSDVPMTEIVFRISTQGLKQFAEITASSGSVQSQGKDPLVWQGDAKEVTFTVGRSPKYSNNSVPNASLGGQLCFLSVEIATDGDTGGVGAIEVDDAGESAEYYDMQGLAIKEPKKGLPVIRVQNGKAKKVIF